MPHLFNHHNILLLLLPLLPLLPLRLLRRLPEEVVDLALLGGVRLCAPLGRGQVQLPLLLG